MENRVKKIGCEMTLTRRVKGAEHTSKYRACLELSADTTFSEMADFIESMRKIWNKAVSVKREADKTFGSDPDFTMEITEHVMNRAENWATECFNRWFTHDISDICTEKGEEGIYLRPDTKYTSENRDMLICKDILRDLAFTLG